MVYSTRVCVCVCLSFPEEQKPIQALLIGANRWHHVDANTPSPPAVSGPSQMTEAGLHGNVGHKSSLVTSTITHCRSGDAQ